MTADVEASATAEGFVGEEGMVPAKDHPQLKGYFRMIRMQVPLQAVKNKMSVELPDFDVDILDDPERLVKLEDAPDDDGWG